MSLLASSISASSAERTPYFSAYSQLTAGSDSSSCYAIIPKSASLGEKRFGRSSKIANLWHTLHLESRVQPLDLEIMAKRLLSSPVAMNLEKLIDPLSKMPKQFKEQINALNSIKNSAAPVALVLEGPDEKPTFSIEERFLIASLCDIYIIAIRTLNGSIKELICNVSQAANKKIKLLIFNTHGLSDLMVTYTDDYSVKDVRKEDFEDLDPDGQIILLACQTGNNIGHRIAEVSNKIVCAAKENFYSLDTFILRCSKHHCLEMRTYDRAEKQHAVIFKGNEVRDPCINAELEKNMTVRQFEYLKNFLIDSEDMFVLGVLMEKKGKTLKAKKWYLEAAKLGNPKAMINLGVLLKKDGNKQGRKYWYLEAAKLGNPQAMFNLGALLQEEDDKQGSKYWYLEAAKLENLQAMFNLGVLLLEEGDKQGAKYWYLQAAQLENLQAMFSLGVLLQEEGNKQGAKYWYLEAAQLENPQAMLNLGILLEEEEDEEDIQGAEIWYKKAADLGNIQAMLNLGILLEEEEEDIQGAKIWYKKAADLGNTQAMNHLGA
jgi:TPR repeat protein